MAVLVLLLPAACDSSPAVQPSAAQPELMSRAAPGSTTGGNSTAPQPVEAKARTNIAIPLRGKVTFVARLLCSVEFSELPPDFQLAKGQELSVPDKCLLRVEEADGTNCFCRVISGEIPQPGDIVTRVDGN